MGAVETNKMKIIPTRRVVVVVVVVVARVSSTIRGWFRCGRGRARA